MYIVCRIFVSIFTKYCRRLGRSASGARSINSAPLQMALNFWLPWRSIAQGASQHVTARASIVPVMLRGVVVWLM